ncbi:restriction endonuclease [Clostridium estertheticum]|uniref:restriction endonuclease n=1 Tax=Clostridium estertheticum TaxID=238834 RepID=UPI001C7D7BF9|nr:restriction endonuclease [Clostridium estertheticum]MBX4258831.1 restriction endonuclease [Clostridium estertheticum]WLC69163.1 restriction endonuclease [Clostridium estertheticum]
MKLYNNIQLYKLDKFHREQLHRFEKDRLLKELNEEDYIRVRISRFFEFITPKKNTRSRDDGIDFILRYNGKIFVFQLKYWKSSLGRKLIKEIYGQMYLSNISMKYRENGEKLIYLLLCPFVNNECTEINNEYLQENYYIVSGEKFVEFLINPLCFMQKKIYEKKEY